MNVKLARLSFVASAGSMTQGVSNIQRSLFKSVSFTLSDRGGRNLESYHGDELFVEHQSNCVLPKNFQ